MRIAVLNAGTGTIKAALLEPSDAGVAVLGRGAVDLDDAAPESAFAGALAAAGARAEVVDATAHRVVHGGARFSDPVVVDEGVEREIEALAPLAPLHNPLALRGLRVARGLYPGKPAVAVFDTAFHAGRPAESLWYALPRDTVESLGLYRYGFHGIAHASLVESLAAAQGPGPEATAVTLQLGAGCSACAVDAGRSVETSMGFTPLEGLVMASRSGSVDPGLILHLLRGGLDVERLEAMLTRESGLRGLTGSADVREVLRAEERGDPRARLALGLFVRRIVTVAGGYFTLLGGRGALVFGGGIGTHSAVLRARIAAGLTAWNVELDPQANRGGSTGRISTPGSRPVYVFETDEERPIARGAYRLLRKRSD